MKHSSIAFLTAGLLSVAVWAGAAFGVDMRSGERVEAAGELSDIAFVAARDAHVSAVSTDDIVVAARTVRLDGARADHFFIAGADAQATTIAAQDMFAAGCQLRLQSGAINDDLVGAGCRIETASAFTVNGAAILTAGEIDIEGPIGGGLRAAGNEVRLNGPVTGDVDIRADTLTLGPRAQIIGNLTYRAVRVAIDPAAIVTGTSTALPAPPAEHERQLGLGAALAFMAAMLLVLVLGVSLLVLVAVALFPGLMNNAARTMRETPLRTLGAGFVFMALAPVLIGFLFVTLLGIPLALMIGALYLAVAPFAFAAVVYFIGLRIRALVNRSAEAQAPRAWARLGWSMLATIALLLVGFVPIVGGAFWLIAYVIGLGAIVLQGRYALASAPAPPVPHFAS
ncbi:MAG: polymer-forming cytoskeletal protein [Hyphomonadaceae bacterium]|nr:polymer-forming cytoskeletal protein [Hyphomonadaceae bacterium]